MKKETQRLYYIDWLRVLAMISIFFFHADRFFDDFDWHVKNPDHNLISTLHVAFFSQWMMPLFFILSGAAVFYSLKFRSGATFIRERVQRILIPLLIVGYFITSPPQMYFERLTHGKFEGSFFEFIPFYFQGVDMFGGNFPWHGFHLWYLVYLFAFSIILLPLFKPGNHRKTGFIVSVSCWFEKPWHLILLVIPLILINILIDLNGLDFMRGTGGWDLFSYLFIFIYGYLFFCNEEILETIKRLRSVSFFMAVILSITGLVVHFGIKPEISRNTPILYLILTCVRCFCVLLWITAIIGFGEKFLNFKNRFLEYANEAVMPFYILHQFVLLLIGYWVVQLEIYTFFKYIFISGLSFAVIMGLCDFIIKRFQPARFLFGLKGKYLPKMPSG